MRNIAALGLYSGGLDSILSCRLLAEQGIEVTALKFVTPFFDYTLLERQSSFAERVWRTHGIRVKLIDISKEYIELLKAPPHGYGKRFNPCIDCKILMLRTARELMPRYKASFLFTGEVIGQRPMSQRRDTLRVIERDSGCEGILLRPLCAGNLPETVAEREGLVDRSRLCSFSGRGRSQQIELAAQLGITEYPAPAGGCVLTDLNLAKRIRLFYEGGFAICNNEFAVGDIRLLLVGRQFLFPDSGWFVIGRDQQENETVQNFRGPGDWIVRVTDRPGPTGLLRHGDRLVVRHGWTEIPAEVLHRIGGLIVRYGRKAGGVITPGKVSIDTGTQQLELENVAPVDDSVLEWQV